MPISTIVELENFGPRVSTLKVRSSQQVLLPSVTLLANDYDLLATLSIAPMIASFDPIIIWHVVLSIWSLLLLQNTIVGNDLLCPS